MKIDLITLIFMQFIAALAVVRLYWNLRLGVKAKAVKSESHFLKKAAIIFVVTAMSNFVSMVFWVALIVIPIEYFKLQMQRNEELDEKKVKTP